jgi:putative transcriptional regulator
MLKNSVEELRRSKGVTKSHLARQIHVCASYITRLEKWEIQPSGKVMFRLARYFGCRIEDVFEPEAPSGRKRPFDQ